MKIIKGIIIIATFIFAIASALATRIQEIQLAYYDANGILPSGAAQGRIDNTYEPCMVQIGTICTISDEWAFDTGPHAQANLGGKTNVSATGILRYYW